MKTLLIGIILPLALMTTACSKADPVWMVPPPAAPAPAPVIPPPPPQPNLGRAIDTGTLNQTGFNPKLEVIFVIDNSTSMEDEINKVSANINQFVDAFTKNTPFEYNVAVMSVYDHRRFKNKEFLDKFGGTEYEFDVGEFRQVKDRNGRRIEGQTFINSNEQDVAEKLKATLKIGIQSLMGAGPEVEESFSPISAAYGFGQLKQKSETIEKQKGFFMGPDAYKVIFFVTDASDNSTMTDSDLYLNLVARSNMDTSKVMGFGAISKGNCTRDPGIKNSKIEGFLNQARPSPDTQNVVSLCSDFGAKFASFGKAIRDKILSQNIPLSEIPDFSNPNAGTKNECLKPRGERTAQSIVVCYGSQRIFLRTTINGAPGYRFNPETNSISLDEELSFDSSQKGSVIEVEYTPLNEEVREKDHVRAWGQ